MFINWNNFKHRFWFAVPIKFCIVIFFFVTSDPNGAWVIAVLAIGFNISNFFALGQ